LPTSRQSQKSGDKSPHSKATFACFAAVGVLALILTGCGKSDAERDERKVLYYQSAMHPWVKSDKPGRCTICGMELTPVYEGDPGIDAAGGDLVPLTQSM